MRSFFLLLVTAALAWGLWTLLGSAEERPFPVEAPPEEPPVPEEADTTAARRARLTTGTLVVTVQTPKGEVPPGAVAGYRFAGEDRLRRPNREGQVRFTDAPLGPLSVVARAPGFVEAEQRRPLLAGVRLDVVLVLRPEGTTKKP